MLNADRLLPADPAARSLARRIHAATAELPIISPHGHVDPMLLVRDEPFRDPASLLIQPDHYVTRLLVARGVDLAELRGDGSQLTEAQARRAWRLLCENWVAFRGTPMRVWMESQLADIFDVDATLNAATADSSFDALVEKLAQPEFRPRALFERFRISALATTDDPLDDLAAHDQLNSDPTFRGRIMPTFRPDRYLEVLLPSWHSDLARLAEVTGVDTATRQGWVEAMANRRAYFVAHGAVSTDHSHADPGFVRLPDDDADRLYREAVAGRIEPSDAITLRRHLMFEMAALAAADGLTMTLHPGVHRNHHGPTFDRFGADTGHDFPMATEFAGHLRPMLDAFGMHPGFRVVLFTMDESVSSREIAPLASFYPSVYIGAPWWFLDAPDAVNRWRAAVTESAGFLKTSGFVDDTRAFTSIPARHDMSRRLDAGYLARLVLEHRLGEDEAFDTARDLVTGRPVEAFGL